MYHSIWLRTPASIPPAMRAGFAGAAACQAETPSFVTVRRRSFRLPVASLTRAIARLRGAEAVRAARRAVPHTCPGRTLERTFSQASAIQGSSLRSRVRRFESCWGRR